MEALGAAVPLSFPAAKATTPWLTADSPAQIYILSQGSSYSGLKQCGGKKPL